MRLGKLVSGAVLNVDVSRLVDTRMLVQANSGGGKSWMLRLIAERAGIQTIVIDPEGEFASLREALDMVLVSRDGGDLPADPRSAALLARRLVEHRVSAVIDLYELEPDERRRFVRIFLDSMVRLPKNLWHPLLVMVDEAQMFCPEKGEGEAESTKSVITFCSLARKRGYAPILATQRLSKLHKDAAAELNNVVIGRTWLDNDQVRAGKVLGMGTAERIALRDLAQGEFYAFGPALFQADTSCSAGVVRFRSDAVKTTHPKPGSRHLMTPPAPSNAIRSVLAKLADLPKQAEEEARTIEQLRAENTRLKREMKARPSSPPADHRSVDDRQVERAVKAAVEPLKKRFRAFVLRTNGVVRRIHNLGAVYQQSSEETVSPLWKEIAELNTEFESGARFSSSNEAAKQVPIASVHASAPLKPKTERALRTLALSAADHIANNNIGGADSLAQGERRVLTAIAQYPDGVEREQLGVLTAYKKTSRDTYLKKLRAAGLIEERGGQFVATEGGIDALGPDFVTLPTGNDLYEWWRTRLPAGELRILEALHSRYPDFVTRPTLQDATDYKKTSVDTYLKALRARKLIEDSREGVRAAAVLFD